MGKKKARIKAWHKIQSRGKLKIKESIEYVKCCRQVNKRMK